MNVTILINESQKNRILLESNMGQFKELIKKNYELVKKILEDSSKQINMDLTFLITWGATIGGVVGPISEFVQGKFPELNDIQLSLILTGVIATYYYDNKDVMNKLYQKLNEEGIFSIFMKVIKKSDELVDAFLDFMGSLGITLHKVTNMISYAFIIPIIPMIYEMAMSGISDEKRISEIVIRTLSFGLITTTGIALKEIIIKIVKRFKRKDI